MQRHGFQRAAVVREAVEDDDPVVSMSHAQIIGFSMMLFMQNDKKLRKKIEEDFKASVQVLSEHLRQRKKTEPSSKG